jgi:light-regulated signal transduction histidine kinase (bacteriophytochrome)
MNHKNDDDGEKVIKSKKDNNNIFKHDVTNVLNIISSYSQLIELCVNDTEKNHQEKLILYSKQIKNNVDSLAKIINNAEEINK